MSGPSLPTLDPEQEGLGVDTIMAPTLAARHGVPYVHLAVFAIDVDRVRAQVEQDPELDEATWPFAWEVFLTEAHLVSRVDPRDSAQHAMIEDTCLGILDRRPETEPPLGAQLVFAVYDAVQRGVWPAELQQLFAEWKAQPRQLVETLASFWAVPFERAATLAEACLDVDMAPPLAEPTLDALVALEGGDLEPQGISG